MPEGDTIFRAARTLNRALAGSVVTGFETVLPKLSRVEFDSGITGRTVESVSAKGKWMSMNFSGGLVLLTHMLMNGSWHIYRPGESWQRRQIDMRIVIKTDKDLGGRVQCAGCRIPYGRHSSPASGLSQFGSGCLGRRF